MKIYILTCVNEDGWVYIVGTYKAFELARSAMKTEQMDQVDSLDQEGYVPVMKRDENAAIITWGNGHFYRYKIHIEEVKL